MYNTSVISLSAGQKLLPKTTEILYAGIAISYCAEISVVIGSNFWPALKLITEVLYIGFI